MRAGLIASAAGVAVMVAVIAHAWVSGDFRTEVRELLAMPWGRGTLIDLYVGLVIFSVYVACRERNWSRSALWITLIMCLGNLATCIYLVLNCRPGLRVSAPEEPK
ncbi:MAG: DUF1475 domain-containing protein [Phycisphaerae bacterium]|nr:DUF1475 domain-containing protein [Phycisphaerae bacterium]